MAILGASAHIFGENVRAGALFALLAHKLGKIMRGGRMEGQVTGKMGGFVVGKGGERGEGTIFRANSLDIKNF